MSGVQGRFSYLRYQREMPVPVVYRPKATSLVIDQPRPPVRRLPYDLVVV